MFPIARYFSDGARRAAATSLYSNGRTGDGYCPIGVMLLYDGYDAPKVPLALETACALLGIENTDLTFNDTDSEASRIFCASWDFAQVWDEGPPLDLFDALCRHGGDV